MRVIQWRPLTRVCIFNCLSFACVLNRWILLTHFDVGGKKCYGKKVCIWSYYNHTTFLKWSLNSDAVIGVYWPFIQSLFRRTHLFMSRRSTLPCCHHYVKRWKKCLKAYYVTNLWSCASASCPGKGLSPTDYWLSETDGVLQPTWFNGP